MYINVIYVNLTPKFAPKKNKRKSKFKIFKKINKLRAF